VNIALPGSDSDDEFCTRRNLDDRHASAHSINSADNVHLSAEQQEGNVLDCDTTGERERLPQAAVEPSDDSRKVLLAPEIKLTPCDDEPVIEVTRYY